MQTCVECKGTGVFDRIDFDEIPCPVCNGAGELPDHPVDSANPEVPKSVPKDAVCPYCGGNNGSPDDAFPCEPGRVGVCFHCLNVSVLGNDLRQRKPTDEERLQIIRHPMWPHSKAMIEYIKNLRADITVQKVVDVLKKSKPQEPK
jgi:hypothetical protein